MPYIAQSEREILDPLIDQLAVNMEMSVGYPPELQKAGRLNYVISRLMVRMLPNEKRYWALALAIGTVVCAILEFYRRFVGPYEDEAIRKNGDIKEYCGKPMCGTGGPNLHICEKAEGHDGPHFNKHLGYSWDTKEPYET